MTKHVFVKVFDYLPFGCKLSWADVYLKLYDRRRPLYLAPTYVSLECFKWDVENDEDLLPYLDRVHRDGFALVEGEGCVLKPTRFRAGLVFPTIVTKEPWLTADIAEAMSDFYLGKLGFKNLTYRWRSKGKDWGKMFEYERAHRPWDMTGLSYSPTVRSL